MMITHPAQSLFMGCFPMGAATLINAGLVSVPGCTVIRLASYLLS